MTPAVLNLIEKLRPAIAADPVRGEIVIAEVPFQRIQLRAIEPEAPTRSRVPAHVQRNRPRLDGRRR